MKSINDAHIDMRQQLAKFKQSTRDHIMKFGEIDEKHSACLTKLQNLSIKAGIEAEKATAKAEKEIKKNLEDVPSRKQMDLKVERMKLPTFAGNIRHYRSFKSNFDKSKLGQNMVVKNRIFHPFKNDWDNGFFSDMLSR